jgi:hypothetical protein
MQQAADEAAELVRQNKLTKRDALQRLAAECPGFSLDAYERAFGAGLFNTR